MTTITHPTFAARATTEALASFAVVALLVLVIWMMVGGTRIATDTDGGFPIPTSQAQVAPKPGR